MRTRVAVGASLGKMQLRPASRSHRVTLFAASLLVASLPNCAPKYAPGVQPITDGILTTSPDVFARAAYQALHSEVLDDPRNPSTLLGLPLTTERTSFVDGVHYTVFKPLDASAAVDRADIAISVASLNGGRGNPGVFFVVRNLPALRCVIYRAVLVASRVPWQRGSGLDTGYMVAERPDEAQPNSVRTRVSIAEDKATGCVRVLSAMLLPRGSPTSALIGPGRDVAGPSGVHP